MKRDMDAVFAALADPTRRRVLQFISESGGASATELAEHLPVSRQAIVKHLGALGEAGLVRAERDGRRVRYSLTPAPMSDAMGWMSGMGAEWDERLAVLRRTLDEGSGA